MKSTMNFSQVSTTSIDIVSAGMSSFRKFFFSHFPSDYFKSSWIRTGIDSIDEQFSRDKQSIAFRKAMPAIAFYPQIVFDDTIGSVPAMMPLFYDPQNDSHRLTLINAREIGQRLLFEFGRYKLNISVSIRVPNEVQMVNLIGYMKRQLRHKNYFFLNNEPILVEIPNAIITLMAKDLNLNLADKDDVNILINHIQSNAQTPIDIKIREDSRRKVLSFVMVVNMLCRIEDIPEPSDPNMVNRTQDKCQFNFPATCEFSFPARFKLYLENLSKEENFEDMVKSASLDAPFNAGLNFVAAKSAPGYVDDKKMIFSTSFITDINKEIDNLKLDDVLPEALKLYISETPTEVVKETVLIKLFKDDSPVPITDYFFEPRNLQIRLIQLLRNYVYSVVVYIDPKILHPYHARLMGTDVNEIFDKHIRE